MLKSSELLKGGCRDTHKLKAFDLTVPSGRLEVSRKHPSEVTRAVVMKRNASNKRSRSIHETVHMHRRAWLCWRIQLRAIGNMTNGPCLPPLPHSCKQLLLARGQIVAEDHITLDTPSSHDEDSQVSEVQVRS